MLHYKKKVVSFRLEMLTFMSELNDWQFQIVWHKSCVNSISMFVCLFPIPSPYLLSVQLLMYDNAELSSYIDGGENFIIAMKRVIQRPFEDILIIFVICLEWIWFIVFIIWKYWWYCRKVLDFFCLIVDHCWAMCFLCRYYTYLFFSLKILMPYCSFTTKLNWIYIFFNFHTTWPSHTIHFFK